MFLLIRSKIPITHFLFSFQNIVHHIVHEFDICFILFSSGINRSFTALSSPTRVPILRRANSLTSGIPSLSSVPLSPLKQPICCDNNDHPVSPNYNSEHLLNNVQSAAPVCKQPSRNIPTLGSQQKGKASCSIKNFSMAVTSTPTRKGRYTSPNCSTLKCLASPIPIRDVKEKPSLQIGAPAYIKTAVLPANKSVDSTQQKENVRLIPERHRRSKSVSSIQPAKQKTAPTQNYSGNGIRKDRSKSPSFKMGTSKPLVMKNLNNQCATYKENSKVGISAPISGSNQKRPSQILQVCLM
jgi:hypothetical protein